MAMERPIRASSIVILVVATIFAAFGIALVGVGSWMISDVEVKTFIKLMENIPSYPRGQLFGISIIMMIVLGALLAIANLLAIIAVWKKSRGLLTIISYCVIASIGGSYKDAINVNLVSDLKTGYNSKFTNTSSVWTYSSNSELSKAMDVIQVKQKCCGVSNWRDLGNVSNPFTCCSLASSDDEIKSMTDVIWSGSGELEYVGNKCYIDKGCLNYMTSFMKWKTGIIMNIYHGLWGPEVAVFVNALMLSRYLKMTDGMKY